jgi:hypothetical protein
MDTVTDYEFEPQPESRMDLIQNCKPVIKMEYIP